MIDNIILIVFGTLSTIALIVGILSFRLAMKYAKRNDKEMKMITWTIVGLGGFIFAAVSWAYFLFPIVFARLFN